MTRTTELPSPTKGLEFSRRDQVGTGAGVPREFRHPHAVVEVLDGLDYGFAFRPCLRELHCIRKLVFGNINSGFHVPMMTQLESHLYTFGF